MWEALSWLNRTVSYRYTGIFAFAGPILRSVCLVDKEDRTVKTCPDLPVGDSYCIYVLRSQEPFAVEDATTDSRVENHPKTATIHSYYGVPLLNKDGKLVGTICHFDPDAVHLTEEVVTVLDDLAVVIAEEGFVTRRDESDDRSRR